MDQSLLKAADNGDLSTVRKLLKKLPLVNCNVRDDVAHESALCKASKGGYFEISRLLIEAGADVNAKDSYRVTPLHLATKGKHTELVKLLVLNGAQLDAATVSNLKPMDMAPYDSEIWQILQDAKQGDMPELEEWSEVPIIPDFALMSTGKKKRKGTGKKKGKKGGKKKKGKKKKK